ncbi:phosphatase PAP2 family protein [Shewanella avicenniae]|uniref:undecaprenyl-diphosphate phosphatase n=1 Tax=Shewanella avicenniae TaxID=2814294 RepID=A0ABX7QRH7_9GAMM|nr:phosphatase PAP2 family protein [Shewanella avicenniae]QSX34051.1 phosphatase PAP2 family protein [Shewanella avicenniae]
MPITRATMLCGVTSWLLLLLPPLLVTLSGRALFPLLDLSSGFAELNYALTMTGTRPWGVVTSIVVLGWVLVQLPSRLRLPIFCTLLLALGLNLLLSHGLKQLFAEPRPYVEYLAQHGLLNLSQFYQADSSERSVLLAALSRDQLPIPISANVWSQWQFETSYSFPSGHTLFSCTLALSSSVALLKRKRILLPMLLLCWAWWVSLSRILLGMHWPIDVLASALLAGVITLVSNLIMHWLTAKFITNTERD